VPRESTVLTSIEFYSTCPSKFHFPTSGVLLSETRTPMFHFVVFTKAIAVALRPIPLMPNTQYTRKCRREVGQFI